VREHQDHANYTIDKQWTCARPRDEFSTDSRKAACHIVNGSDPQARIGTAKKVDSATKYGVIAALNQPRASA
jgi:hypothetical protein